jgi:hypothetical protein
MGGQPVAPTAARASSRLSIAGANTEYQTKTKHQALDVPISKISA